MQYTHRYFLCPFYCWDERNNQIRSVHCEGKTSVRFASPRDAGEYYDRYCCGDWERCSVAILRNEKYEEEK